MRPGGRLAVFAIDPGGTTGCARGLFDLGFRSVEEIVLNAVELESWELTGDWRRQSEALAREVYGWPAELVMTVGAVSDYDVVVESFEHRPGRALSGDPYVPVKIAARLEGLMVNFFNKPGQRPLVYQAPSERAVVSDSMLRDLGLWTVGSDHERDAWRHVVKRLMGLRAGVRPAARRRVVRRRRS